MNWRKYTLLSLVGSVVVLVAACSAPESLALLDDDGGDTTGTGAAGGSGPGSAVNGVGGSSVTIGSGGSGQGGMENCHETGAEAKKKHLDMFVVMDRSGSMIGTKWNGTVAALTNYWQNAQAGESAALTFFPKNGVPFGETCEPKHYDPPHVPLEELPMHATTLIGAMAMESPGGGTPTYGPLHATYLMATELQDQNPDHVVIIVLATDGQPNGCTLTPTVSDMPNPGPYLDNQNTTATLATLAKKAFDYNSVMTFCVAIQGAQVTALDQIAKAGGTGQAFDVTSDVTLFAQKMQEIRAQALGCEYDIPDPDEGEAEFDPTKLNVKYTPGGMGKTIEIPKADNQGDCGSVHGWYYDDNNDPKKIYLCPATCSMVQSDAAAVIELLFGCPTINN
jgi:hypothetical protein